MYLQDAVEQEMTGSACSEIQIKLSIGLTPADSDEILELSANCQCLPQAKLSMLEKSIWEEAYNEGEPYTVFIKASIINDDKETLVGFACFGFIPEENDCVELYLIVVDEEFRGIGIGSAIMDELFRQISAISGDTVFCEIPDGRKTDAIRTFFEEQGFARQRKHYRFFIPEKGNSVYASRVS